MPAAPREAPLGPLRPGRTGAGDNGTLLAMAETIGNMGHWYWHVASDVISVSGRILAPTDDDSRRGAPGLTEFLNRCHPDDRPQVELTLRKALASCTDFEFDARIVHPDGEVRNVIISGQPEIMDGRVVALFGVFTDITEAFATLQSYQEQHEMLRLAAEIAQLGHWVWDADEAVLSYCSDELARIHGMSMSAFVARFTHPQHFADALAAPHRLHYREALADALAEGKPYAIEYRVVTPSGADKDVREIGHPLFDRDERLVRFIGTVQDVTEAKQRENELREAKAAIEQKAEALRRSETKLRGVIEASTQGIVVLRGYRPVFANQAYAQMVGLERPEQVLAMKDLWAIVVKQHEQNDLIPWKDIAAGRADSTVRQVEIRTFDGRDLWIDFVVQHIEWEGEPANLATIVDVTERHLAEQELKKKTEELQELNVHKDRLFSVIAHDLRGPFNSMIGFAELLAETGRDLTPEKVTEYARIIRDTAVSTHGLFDNLLMWAAVQLRDAAPRLTPVDLAVAADDSIRPIMPISEAKGVAVINAIRETAPGAHVLADEDLLRIVLRNLVSNGVKFCHSGGSVRLSACVADVVRITVTDTGVGMNAAEVANLFTADHLVPAAGTGGERGTGFGLYLCRDIVKRHSGKILVEAKPGEGSAFHVELRAAVPV